MYYFAVVVRWKQKNAGGLVMKNSKQSRTIALGVAIIFVLALLAAGCGGGGSKPAEPGKAAAPVKWVANSVWPPPITTVSD